jgi:hypothetical protein
MFPVPCKKHSFAWLCHVGEIKVALKDRLVKAFCSGSHTTYAVFSCEPTFFNLVFIDAILLFFITRSVHPSASLIDLFSVTERPFSHLRASPGYSFLKSPSWLVSWLVGWLVSWLVGWLVSSLFYDVFWVTRLCCVDDRMTSEWWYNGKDLVGSGRGVILRYYPGTRLEGLRKTTIKT